MSTSNEKTQINVDVLKETMKRIYKLEIKPYFDFLDVTYYHTPEDKYLSSDIDGFFENKYSDFYKNYEQFRVDVVKCLDIYNNKLSENAVKKYADTKVMEDTILMTKVGITCSKLVTYLKACLKVRNEAQERLHGEETRAPQRKRAAPKKRTPAVRVDVRKMF